MKLTIEQIEDLIQNPASGGDLEAGVSVQDEHKLHVIGQGYSAKLKQLEGFESDNDFSIRQQVTGPATMRLCAIILDNLNRWVTNQGTVKSIQFKQNKAADEFQKVLGQIWRGKSLEDFIRTFYKESIYQEMNGFLLITKPQINPAEGIQIREGIESPYDPKEALLPYMIFYAAEDIHDFEGIGDDIEYLIIKYGKGEDGQRFFRVIDDEKDVIVIESNKKVMMRDTDIVKNELGYVPAIQISNINKKLRNAKVKTSPIDHVLPDLNRYMQKDSDLIIQMVRHMYPKLASVTTPCKMCDGQGYHYDKETKIKCNDCNGSGKTVPITRDGVLGLPQYIDEGKTPYPGSPASYITPDNDSLVTAMEDLKDLSQEILYSATGDKNLVTETLNTATENLINYKGLEDRIAEIIEMVESREQFIIKTVALMHRDFAASFKGCSVRYGRRLSIRGESEIMNEIKSAKEAGMPISHVSALQRELIYSRYKNNHIELERQLLLADLEPLSGYTVDEIKDISQYVDPIDLRLKFNFNKVVDWFEATVKPITEFQPDAELKKRVEAITLKLKDHDVLQISGTGGQDREPVLASPDQE